MCMCVSEESLVLYSLEGLHFLNGSISKLRKQKSFKFNYCKQLLKFPRQGHKQIIILEIENSKEISEWLLKIINSIPKLFLAVGM